MKTLIEYFKSLPWKEAIKAALKVIVPAVIGSGAAILTGCSAMTPATKTQTMSLYAIGIPGVVVVTQSTQTADNKGDDENTPIQSNAINK